MTVSSPDSSITHDCDGVSTAFAVPFYFLQASHLVVSLISADPAADPTILVLGSDYTVSGAGSPTGGVVTTAATYVAGNQITIDRVVPVTQEVAYQANDPFPARTHERALDKLTMIAQQLWRLVGAGNPLLSRFLMLGSRDINGAGAYRANNNRIRDLGDPIADLDAVNRRTAQALDAAIREYAERLVAGVAPGSGTGSFMQSGLGAAIRTFQSKLRDNLVTLEDFGAIGDGTAHPLSERYASLALAQFVYASISITTLDETIDSAAFRAAMAAVQSGARGGIQITPKTFVLNSVISCSNSAMTIIGAGIQSSILKFTAGGLLIDNSELTSAVRFGVCISGISVLAAAGAVLDVGLDFRGVRGIGYNNQLDLRACEINGESETGRWQTCLSMDTASQSTIDHCQIGSVSGSARSDYGILLNEGNSIQILNSTFHGCEVGVGTVQPTFTEGVYIAGCNFLVCRDGVNTDGNNGNQFVIVGNHFAVGRDCITFGRGAGSTNGGSLNTVVGNFALAHDHSDFAGDVFSFMEISSDYNSIVGNQAYNPIGVSKPSYLYRLTRNVARAAGPTSNAVESSVGLYLTKMGVIAADAVSTQHFDNRRVGIALADELQDDGTNTTYRAVSAGIEYFGRAVSLRNGRNDAKEIRFHSSGGLDWDARIVVTGGDGTNNTGTISLGAVTAVTRVVRPDQDNTRACGQPTFRYSVFYGGSSAINTSDARLKSPVRGLTGDEVLAARDLAAALGIYQWLDAIEAKGEGGARLHAGITAQGAMTILEQRGLDPFRYGFICYDQWDDIPGEMVEHEATPAVVAEDGTVLEPAGEAYWEVIFPDRAAGDLFSLRYEEMLAFILAGLYSGQVALESRIAALEHAA